MAQMTQLLGVESYAERTTCMWSSAGFGRALQQTGDPNFSTDTELSRTAAAQVEPFVSSSSCTHI